eukprot:c18699_g1_i1 orf=416-1591(-)
MLWWHFESYSAFVHLIDLHLFKPGILKHCSRGRREMKVQCDVCQKNVATFMCCDDEAVLCADCDTRVHATSKHERIALINPSLESSACCDICQEKTGHFFCLEDRALLCRNCDVSIHLSNVFTSNHKRFLVTGTRVALPAVPTEDALPGKVQSPEPAKKLSPRHGTIPVDSPRQGTTEMITSNLLNATMPRPPGKTRDSPKDPLPLSSLTPAQQNSGVGRPATQGISSDLVAGSIDLDSKNQNASGAAFRSGRISDYFTKTIPGWRVDELLSISDGQLGHHFGAVGPSKADPPIFGNLDWTSDMGFVEGQPFGESLAEVPEMYCPYAPGVPRAGRSTGATKCKNWSELVLVSGFDDSFIVPDFGSSFSPLPFPTPPPQKRSRTFYRDVSNE